MLPVARQSTREVEVEQTPEAVMQQTPGTCGLGQGLGLQAPPRKRPTEGRQVQGVAGTLLPLTVTMVTHAPELRQQAPETSQEPQTPPSRNVPPREVHWVEAAPAMH